MNVRQTMRVLVVAVSVAACVQSLAYDASAIRYRFTFPQPEHHWMQVEATFPALTFAPLELRMSRSSPGRYSLHDFAKNVYDVRAFGANGQELVIARPDPYGWTVADHGTVVIVRYKVFGDRLDGTYLAIDTTHAHINMPSAIMWARGLDDRASSLTFVAPADVRWQVATQLHPSTLPYEFTAPNLQYLMDSPAEFGLVAIQQFDTDGRRFRFAAHHTGTQADLDGLVASVEKIVRQQGAIFGEYPVFEPGFYTFLADYLPNAHGDGMEHRNSTVITSSGSIGTSRSDLLEAIAHEFFHCWNVERIRPRSLEPFDFERANMSGELWLAEGFTQYYGPLTLSRAGLEDLPSIARTMNAFVEAVTLNPGVGLRSAVDMSRMAPFTDGGRTVDPTNWSSTVVSYYTFGAAIGLGLDLALRERSDGRISLDDFMRAMWRVHGKPDSREGSAARPYTLADAENRLSEVSGDPTFARGFFRRYVHGRETPDYARLLRTAGLVLRRARPGVAWWGDVRFERRGGLRIAAAPLANTPAYLAGLDLDDTVRSVDGTAVDEPEDVTRIVRRHKPGDTISVAYVDRSETLKTARVLLVEDPHTEIVPIEATGNAPTPAEAAFREAWLGSKT